jgi:hypothetical protein
MSTSNSFIFPGLDPTAAWQVFDCLVEKNDVRSVVVLSGVNQEASEVFSNEGFFKGLVIKMHAVFYDGTIPRFPLEMLFEKLCHNHPSNCWKLLACSPLDDCLAVNLTFVKSEIPSLCEDLKKRKESATSELARLCGSHGEDPESLIIRAKLSHQQTQQQLSQWTDFWTKKGIANFECEEHPGEEGRDIANFLANRSCILLSGQEEYLFAEAENYQVPLRRDLLPFYRNFCTYSEKSRSLTTKLLGCSSELLRLVSRQWTCVEEKKTAEQEVLLLEDRSIWKYSNTLKNYEIELSNEFVCGVRAEKQLFQIGELINLINKVQESRVRPTVEICNQINNAITGFFSPSVEGHVLLELVSIYENEGLRLFHFSKGNEQMFSEWLTQRFPQYLETLCSILSNVPKNVLFQQRSRRAPIPEDAEIV